METILQVGIFEVLRDEFTGIMDLYQKRPFEGVHFFTYFSWTRVLVGAISKSLITNSFSKGICNLNWNMETSWVFFYLEEILDTRVVLIVPFEVGQFAEILTLAW